VALEEWGIALVEPSSGGNGDPLMLTGSFWSFYDRSTATFLGYVINLQSKQALFE
jgi:hypothetical protein